MTKLRFAHGSRPLRGLEATARSSTGTGKFGRLFRWLKPWVQPRSAQQDELVIESLKGLARLMVSQEFKERVAKGEPPDVPLNEPEVGDENRKIPAGYTYFGQFIDHDITFDPASSLQQQNDPDALTDFRTPRLDLDSVYGRGPLDQPYLYERAAPIKLRLGANKGINGQYRPDLLRNDQGVALIGDKRNDENRIVSQIHALFIRFHNKVVDCMAAAHPNDDETQFLEAQRIVRWTYQWLVLNDFLPRICTAGALEQIFPEGPVPRLRFYRPKSGEPYMPVEFSVAAYRFGHSMVRPSYALNAKAESTARFPTGHKGEVAFSRIPVFVNSANGSKENDLKGLDALPDGWGIDWSYFFGEAAKVERSVDQVPQPSYRIDATLVDPLGELPEFVQQLGAESPFVSLALRNLVRAFRMELPSGQSVAKHLRVPVVADERLWGTKCDGENVENWAEGWAFYTKRANLFRDNAPLWFYLLKEAELERFGESLGSLGSLIVAETLVGLIWFDRYSYLYQVPDWHPSHAGIGLPHRLDMLSLTSWVDS